MSGKTVEIILAGHPIRIGLNHPESAELFREFLTEQKPEDEIHIEESELEKAVDYYPAGTEAFYVECGELIHRVSSYLMKYQCCIFHAVAFLWEGKAWLLTAPSGTGKSTQYFQWKIQYEKEITIINGDKPILECREDGIWVHSSPWKGKEGIHNRVTAPLGGIIYLRQAKENDIRPLSYKEAIPLLLPQFIWGRNEKDGILKVCDILEKMLREAPVWCLSNKGDKESAALTHDTIKMTRGQYEV